MGAWVRDPSPWWLLAAAGCVVWCVLSWKRRSGASALGLSLLVLAVATGFVAEGRLRRLALDWPQVWASRQEAVGTELSTRLDEVIRSADAAVADLAAGFGRPGDPESRDLLLRIRSRTGVDGLAAFGPDGSLTGWTGSHRGTVPDAARLGQVPYLYGEGPLFGYLYVTAPLEATEGTALAAILIREDLPPGVDAAPRGFASRFRRATGESLQVSRAERIRGEAVWDLAWEGATLFSVAVAEPSQAERMKRVRVRWSRPVALMTLAAWSLLLLGGGAGRLGRLLPALSLLALGGLLPLGSLLGIRELISPADFLLPGPFDLTLGTVLGVGLAGAVVVGILAGARPGRRRPIPAALLVVLGFPGVLWLIRQGTSRSFVTGGDGEWLAYQGTLTLWLALVAVLALFLCRSPEEGRASLLHGGLALGAALGLGILSALRVEGQAYLPSWVGTFWVLPVLWLGLRGLGGAEGVRRSALVWACAVALGTSAALPAAWGDRIRARMSVAEEEIERLGLETDPYLEFLLHRMLQRQDTLEAAGASPVEVLYRSWVASGLAEEGYPVRLTYWRGASAVDGLRVGVEGPSSPGDSVLLANARNLPQDTVMRVGVDGAHHLAAGPLPSGATVTALVPPRRSLGLASPLGPLFTARRSTRDPLTLVPLTPEELDQVQDSIRWIRAGEGRQAEFFVAYPDGIYHGHYELELPGPLLETARAVLLLVLNGAVLLALWALGRLAPRPRRTWPPDLPGLLASFRGRLTLTLFGFFLLPTLAFGAVAYQTLTGASVRTAAALAERTVEDGAERYREVDGSMQRLGGRVRGELLLYRGGALAEGSDQALVDLGLYHGWLPPRVYGLLGTGEELLTSVTGSLGSWEYVMAYRRLPGGDILASPAPLEAGATALRRGEVTHLLAFALVIGAVLSVLLSLLAGRTLYRPIQTLQVASERVGRGNLRVRLPDQRSDEFGAVFSAFNRMVLRLRRARRDLVRTSRRTQAIVEEAATGVVALDPQGKVTLMNPRAEKLLGVELETGSGLPGESDPARELARWVGLYFRDGLEEDSTELQVEGRRIRIRARRITRGGPMSGAVLSLEDVTDELRTERILAWGEMARQVAHEVKNPLTPIQLSVQHIRRAWEDRRGDFEAILTTNVEAILREIDRLASIARSFSRFGAPGPREEETPLQPVPLYSVTREVLALYQGGEGTIRFESRVPQDIPIVRARESELKEVLVNLLENARTSVEEGGVVAVEADTVEEGVELRVRDDGSGIHPEILPRVFEPHFSTRSTGTGLGLAIVRRLVESWGGSVSAESREGEGTVIRVRLLVSGGEDGDPHPEGGTIADGLP